MKVKCQVCSSNFVDEKEKENHGHVILLGLIKYPNNFKLKISLITCWTQIKSQILTKKICFNSHVYILYDTYDFIIRYDSYDMHLFIVQFINTSDRLLQYGILYTILTNI